MIEALPVKGYGMYARYRALCIKDGRICPVKYASDLAGDVDALKQIVKCEKVCPTGATYITDSGVVLVDEEKCIDCSFRNLTRISRRFSS